jgi:hypothetical protein
MSIPSQLLPGTKQTQRGLRSWQTVSDNLSRGQYYGNEGQEINWTEARNALVLSEAGPSLRTPVEVSAVSLVTGWGRSSHSRREGSRFLASRHRPYRPWGPLSLLSYVQRKVFPRGQSGRGVKLTTHLQLVPRSRKLGSIRHHSILLN